MANKFPTISDLNPFTRGSNSYYHDAEELTDKKSSLLAIYNEDNYVNRTNVFHGVTTYEGIVVDEPKLLTSLSRDQQSSFADIDVTDNNKYAMKVHIPELHSIIGNPCDVGDLKQLSQDQKKAEAINRVKNHPWFVGDTSDNVLTSARVTFGSIVSVSFEKSPEGGAAINGIFNSLIEPSAVQSIEDLCDKKLSEVYNSSPVQMLDGTTATGLNTGSPNSGLGGIILPKGKPTSSAKPGHIICHDTEHPISWDKVYALPQQENWKASQTHVTSHMKDRPKEIIDKFVCHWDAGLNSEGCIRTMNSRGFHVHFCIDNDGSIIQIHDTKRPLGHATSPAANMYSIGVEVSNAYYSKYQQTYIANGFGARPIRKGAVVRGIVLEDHLGFYDVQLQALKALIESVSNFYSFPIKFPLNPDGTLISETMRESEIKSFKGVLNHFQTANDKIDCAGEPIKELFGG